MPPRRSTSSASPHETKIVSAHRTPKRLYDYAHSARERGLKVVIAGAGGAAHLPGMTASMTSLPVLGVPVESQALKGMDSLLSIVQMPAGVPVGTLAIGKPGAINAGLLAAAMLATQDEALAERLEAWREAQTGSVAEAPNDPARLHHRDHRRRPTRPDAVDRRSAARLQDPHLRSPRAELRGRCCRLYDAGGLRERRGDRALRRQRRRRHLRIREPAGRTRSRRSATS